MTAEKEILHFVQDGRKIQDDSFSRGWTPAPAFAGVTFLRWSDGVIA
jgi:hypothetical protein